ncbi:MAG TPA: 1-deoxy-D-xylulose-5-phosphate reductoisomerase [Bacteroidia bacterium]|nr:1-deoxy-D-xylulose-5-phosphate reductoisomerase [Bacteroidia bacterium]HQK98824.1 1-deoxy-D-xylulose-5-phosphate reductoisomerase [Bacteroidia bacterium]
MKRRIAILGSTGSIGTQALEVIASNPDLFEAEVLTAHSNAALLIEQAKTFKPNAVAIADESKYAEVKEALKDEPIKVFGGYNSIVQLMSLDSIDMVLTAMVGFSGLEPTIAAIKNKKNIALANKETLVVAGDIVTKLALENNVSVYPVDSEHSAIFQCLFGEHHNPIEKIILTASGGPFRGRKRTDLESVTRDQALKHPNWTMGAKITIDSASLMNKGLEIIEAKWLFDLTPSQIEVVVHPQSIIHSLVQFTDGSMKAQMGLPDMKLPIQVAMAFPNRIKSDFPRFNFMDYPQLTFEQPDTETFRCLGLAQHAMKEGGNLPCIMNAANEVAVAAFLNKELRFLEIAEVIEQVMQTMSFIAKPSLDDYRQCDLEARALTKEAVGVKSL